MLSFCHCLLKIRIEIRDKIVESRSRKFATLKQLYKNCAKKKTRRVTESQKREKMVKISRVIPNNVSVI